MSIDLYEVRPQKVYRGVNLISDALTFGRLWLTANRMQSAMQLTTQKFAAGHINVLRNAIASSATSGQ
jgi:hypothetical protein